MKEFPIKDIASALKEYFLSTSRLQKKILMLVSDFVFICVASITALIISNVNFVSIGIEEYLRLLWTPFLCTVIFWYLGVYSSIVRFIDFSVIYILLKALTLAFIINLILKNLLFYIITAFTTINLFPIIIFEGWLVGFMTATILIIGSRVFANYIFSDRVSEKRVVIYGAGSAGIQLSSALRVSKEMQPVAFIDSNPALHDTYLGELKVLHPKKLQKLVRKKEVDEVLIAMPSASKATLKSLLREVEEYSIKVRILPGLADLAQGKVLVSELKEVEIMDLLGRYEVEADQELLDKNIKDKVVLITGAGGSIGSELSRQVCKNSPKQLIILDSNEYGLYEIKNEIQSLNKDIDLHSLIANVANQKRITQICKTFNVNTIYHAAAYKHVPLVEENPFEGVKNNIFGTLSCVKAAIESNVETFVLISTDKAVRPTNIMGATKRFSELILQSYSHQETLKTNTKMSMVRFGNVLGSSGSAIPLFQEQIRNGGPVTVTDPEIIRYFMSIPEAAELVIQAGAMGQGGDLFVLDMGEPVKIIELVKRLINLSGLELKDKNNPNGDIEIIFTGLRPGEKLYEELLIGDTVTKTSHKQILRAEEDFITREALEESFELLAQAEEENDVDKLKQIFKKTIHGYTGYEDNVDVISLQNIKNHQE